MSEYKKTDARPPPISTHNSISRKNVSIPSSFLRGRFFRSYPGNKIQTLRNRNSREIGIWGFCFMDLWFQKLTLGKSGKSNIGLIIFVFVFFSSEGLLNISPRVAFWNGEIHFFLISLGGGCGKKESNSGFFISFVLVSTSRIDSSSIMQKLLAARRLLCGKRQGEYSECALD